jgi:hypothetical protein
MMILKKKLSFVIIICISTSLIFPTFVSGEECNNLFTIENTLVTQTSKLLAEGSFQKDYWAVLIGINDYPGSSSDLPFSVNEILSFKNTLLAGGNWLDSHIRVLTDSSATMDGVFDALNWLDENEDENDISIFYFVGHGTQNSNNERLQVYDGYISDVDLDTKLDDLEGHMVIILDCCFSGGFIEEVGEKGRVVLTACQKDSYAYQDHALKSGIFGYFVNFSLQKITKGAEGTFLFAYIISIIYYKKLSRKYGVDYTVYPCIYDGCFGRTKIIERHSYFNAFLPNLFPVPRNDCLRIWKM